MNQIAERPITPEPALSPGLSTALHSALSPHPGDRGVLPDFAPHIRSEAESAAQNYRRLCQPSGPDRVRRWLLRINAAVRNPASGADLDARVAAMCVLLDEIPAAALTEKTQREAMATFDFWPSVAEVVKLLDPHAGHLRHKLRALERIAGGSQAPAREAPTQQVRDELARKLKAFAAEVQGNPETVASERPEARYLPREMLDRLYAAEGMTGPRTPPHPGGCGAGVGAGRGRACDET